MKRLILIAIVTMLFSSIINIVLVVSVIGINHDVINIVNTTSKIVNTTGQTLNTSLANQQIIIKNQKDIFSYSTNVTKNNMDILKQLLENTSKDTIKQIEKDLLNKSK